MNTLNIGGIEIGIGQPKAGGSGDRFDKERHEGDVCLFLEPEARDIDSHFGTSTAAACDYVVALTDNGAVVYEDQLIFGAALAPAIYEPGQRLVAGRLGRAKKAQAGRNRAWILEPLTADEAAAVKDWAERNVSIVNGRLAVK